MDDCWQAAGLAVDDIIVALNDRSVKTKCVSSLSSEIVPEPDRNQRHMLRKELALAYQALNWGDSLNIQVVNSFGFVAIFVFKLDTY
jgi:hypothetical protein